MRLKLPSRWLEIILFTPIIAVMGVTSLYLFYVGTAQSKPIFYTVAEAFAGFALLFAGIGLLIEFDRFSPGRFFVSQMLLFLGSTFVFSFLQPSVNITSTTCFELGSFALVVTGFFVTAPNTGQDIFDTILLFSITATSAFFISGTFLALHEVISKDTTSLSLDPNLGYAINATFVLGVLDLLVLGMQLYVVLILRRRARMMQPPNS